MATVKFTINGREVDMAAAKYDGISTASQPTVTTEVLHLLQTQNCFF